MNDQIIQKINRLTSKLERTERQLNASRDREIEVRLKARDAQEIRYEKSLSRHNLLKVFFIHVLQLYACVDNVFL